MTIPQEYGGNGRSALERYIVVEDLLAAGAPVAAHWVSDRQVGPNLLRYGSESLKWRYPPAIAPGGCHFALRLSETGAGSRLAPGRAAAAPVDRRSSGSRTQIWSRRPHTAHALT